MFLFHHQPVLTTFANVHHDPAGTPSSEEEEESCLFIAAILNSQGYLTYTERMKAIRSE